MDPAVIGDHVGHRKDPVMALLGEGVRADAGQGALRRDQPVMHEMHPPQDPADAGQLQLRHGCAGQDARPGAGRGQDANGLRREPHVGVQVDAGERQAGLVAQREGVHLAWHRRLDDPHTHGGGDLGCPVGTRVGDHHDVELAWRGRSEQVAQVGLDDRFLVVRRHNDADDRPARSLRDRFAHSSRLSVAREEDSRRGVGRSGSVLSRIQPSAAESSEPLSRRTY